MKTWLLKQLKLSAETLQSRTFKAACAVLLVYCAKRAGLPDDVSDALLTVAGTLALVFLRDAIARPTPPKDNQS